jgi:hypothetical protein
MGELNYPRLMTSMFQNSPSLKNFFYLLLYYLAVSQTSDSNILANLKPNLKIFKDMNQGPSCVCLMEKSGGQKSHATVPLGKIRGLFLHRAPAAKN